MFENFKDLRYFRPESKLDKWGDASKMQRGILMETEKLRDYLSFPVYVLSGYRESSSGSTDSQHRYGNAVDIVVPAFKKNILDLFFAASRFSFQGIGIYRDWKWNGEKIGGLHLDIGGRPHAARWFCYKEDEVQKYVSLTFENLKTCGII